MNFLLQNLPRTRSLILLLAVKWPITLTGYGQISFTEDLELQLGGGTSVPCPSPESYSPSRPDPPDIPTSVGLGMVFLQILQIGEVDESFEVDAYNLLYCVRTSLFSDH